MPHATRSYGFQWLAGWHWMACSLFVWFSGFLVSGSSSGLFKTMTGASPWARFVLSKVNVTWRALTISRCPFEEYNPDNEWFCSFYVCVLEVFAPIPNYSNIFNSTLKINEHSFTYMDIITTLSPWDWHGPQRWRTCCAVDCARVCCHLHTPCISRRSRCLHTQCTCCTVACAHICMHVEDSGRCRSEIRRHAQERDRVQKSERKESMVDCWYSLCNWVRS